MSKYFNETQKASQSALKQSLVQDLDIETLVKRVKEGSTAVANMTEVRLGACNRLEIPRDTKAPLVIRPDDAAKQALEAYRALRTRLMRAQSKSGFRTIAVSSALANEGKTLTVLNLGLCYSQLVDQRVLIIDADLRNRGLTQLLGQPTVPGLAEVLSGQVDACDAVMATDQNNLFVLSSGRVASPPPELLSGSRWQDLLGWCSETFNIILVDTPPVSPLSDFELISSVCDGVIVVVRANRARRDTLQKTLSGLDTKKFLGVVFNGAEVGAETSYGYGYGDT
jgi:capsular exopolysaccharide synthesis family protein